MHWLSPYETTLSSHIQLSFIIFLAVDFLLLLLMTEKLEEVLQRHDLIVEFDMRLLKHPGALLWIWRPLSQLLDFCGDCCNLEIRKLLLLFLPVWLGL